MRDRAQPGLEFYIPMERKINFSGMKKKKKKKGGDQIEYYKQQHEHKFQQFTQFLIYSPEKKLKLI